MAKKKKSATPESTLNAVGLTNELRPRRDPETGKDYLRKKVKDDTGKTVKEEAVFLNSAEGQELVKKVVSEQLRDTPTSDELKFANEVLHKEAMNHPPEKPSNPITGAAPVEQPRKVDQPVKKSRTTFQDFLSAVRNSDVNSYVDAQSKVRVQIPGDAGNGLSESYEVRDERVWAWLWGLYTKEYGRRDGSYWIFERLAEPPTKPEDRKAATATSDVDLTEEIRKPVTA